MPYTLKQPVIDLAAHRGHKPYRYRHGWIPIAPKTEVPKKVGKHLEYTSSSFSSKTVTPEEMESLDYNSLFAKVTDDSLPLDEREKAVKTATMSLQHLQHKISNAAGVVETQKTDLHLKGAGSSVDQTLLKVTKTLKGAQKAKEAEGFVKDVYKDTARVDMTTLAIKVGAAAAAGAASLIGVQESERFSEAFEKLTEYPGVESAINMALTLLITGLIARIVKRWKERRDRRIAEARGEALA